MSNTVEKAKIY